MDKYNDDPEFRKAIDDAFSKAEPAGARHARSYRERAKLAKEAFGELQALNHWVKRTD